jgi:hypothetical protein
LTLPKPEPKHIDSKDHNPSVHTVAPEARDLQATGDRVPELITVEVALIEVAVPVEATVPVAKMVSAAKEDWAMVQASILTDTEEQEANP